MQLNDKISVVYGLINGHTFTVKLSFQLKKVEILMTLEIRHNWITQFKIAWKCQKFEFDILNFDYPIQFTVW